MMKKLRFLFAGLLLAAAGVASATYVAAAYSQYVGFNPNTNQTGFLGQAVALGSIPLLDTTTTACGTTATVQASGVGGSSVFQFTAGATTCTLKINFPTQAPNGYFCVASDETTPADTVRQSAHDASSCTVTGTVVSSDKVLIEVNGF
jgi:hypothetical protein